MQQRIGRRLIGAIVIFNITFIESIPQEEIRRFCRRWRVRELDVFGSALRSTFRPDSDVDVLVSFHGSAHWGLFDRVQMRLELEAIFKRKVDLVTRRALEQSQNRLLREHILNTAQTILADNEAAHAEG
jgi:predicted nucleotidyltransferase